MPLRQKEHRASPFWWVGDTKIHHEISCNAKGNRKSLIHAQEPRHKGRLARPRDQRKNR
jgi:hypothetical protein